MEASLRFMEIKIHGKSYIHTAASSYISCTHLDYHSKFNCSQSVAVLTHSSASQLEGLYICSGYESHCTSEASSVTVVEKRCRQPMRPSAANRATGDLGVAAFTVRWDIKQGINHNESFVRFYCFSTYWSHKDVRSVTSGDVTKETSNWKGANASCGNSFRLVCNLNEVQLTP